MVAIRGLVLLLACWLAWPSAADAQTALSWRRAAGAERCPGRAEIVRAVRARTGISPQQAVDGAERSLSVRVVATKPGYHVLLKLRAADGRLLGARELADESDDCSALGDAVVLTIALMIGPDREPPARDEVLPARPPWRFGLRGGALGSQGLLPAPRVHALLGAQLTPAHRRFAFDLAVAAFGSARASTETGGARFTPAFALLSTCLRVVPGAVVRFDACFGAQIGAVRARASGFTGANHEAAALLTGAVLRAPLGVRLSERFELVTAPTAGVPLLRSRFEALNAAGQSVELARSARLFFMLELGLLLWL